MKTQKLIPLCLILALLAALMCLPAAAAEVSDWNALSAALQQGGAVKLSADVTAPAERTRILEVPAGVTALLDLNGFTLDGGTPGEEDCVVLVHGSFTLTDSSDTGTGRITGKRDGVDVLGGDFTLAGGTMDGCGNDGVAVAEGGRLTMTGGTVRGSGQIGVYVTGEGSMATVSGGEISGSVGYYEDDWFYHGAGLQVEYGAVAEIAGGVISGNVFGAKSVEATLTVSGGELRDSHVVPLSDEGLTYGGAGLYSYQGVIRMTGGTVSGNAYAGLYTDVGSVTEITGGAIIGGGEAAVRMLDGEVYLGGGAVSGGPKDAFWLSGGAVTMTDGVISDCGWNGAHLDAGSFTMSGGEIRDCGYDGVILIGEDAVCSMAGGTISGCRGAMSVEDNWYNGGNGVELRAGSFEMTGGEIFDNAAGIAVLGGSAAMRGGVVRGSHIGYYSGELGFGGTGAEVGAGTFRMTGGELRDNEALGLLVGMEGSADISGGTISGSGNYGLQLLGGTLALSGSPVFADNGRSDISLLSGLTLTVAGPLALDKPLSVWTYDLELNQGEEVNITTGLPGNGSAADFVFATPAYEIAAGADGEAKAVYVRYYPDVTSTDWYAEAAAYAASKGLFDPHDGRFDGDQPLTNADLLMALWRFAGSPKVETDDVWPYSDVAADAPLADAIRWIESRGSVPDTAGLAEPDNTVHRWNMLGNCLALPGVAEQFEAAEVSGELPFPDAGEMDEEWTRYTLWLTEQGILRGMGDGTMSLEQTATRAQLATVLLRLSVLFG